jgi:hypothetical protein
MGIWNTFEMHFRAESGGVKRDISRADAIAIAGLQRGPAKVVEDITEDQHE